MQPYWVIVMKRIVRCVTCTITSILVMSMSTLVSAQSCTSAGHEGEFAGSWPIVVSNNGANPERHVVLDINRTDEGYAGIWTMEKGMVVWTLNGKLNGEKLVLESVGPPQLGSGVQIVGVDGISLELVMHDGILKGQQFFRNGGVRHDMSVNLEAGHNLCSN